VSALFIDPGGCTRERKGPYLLVVRGLHLVSLVLLGLWAAACLQEGDSIYRKLCDPIAGEISPAAGSPSGGFEVVIEGRFLSTYYEGLGPLDIAARVAGHDAEVISVTAQGCDPCDACLLDADVCLDCRYVCDGVDAYGDEQDTCLEQVAIVMPPGDPGEVVVSVFNGHGGTADYTFTYLPWCADGTDNDGDGYVDAEDPGCVATDQALEVGPCEDGADNDGDSWIDGDDPGCQGDPAGATEEMVWDTQCNNGADDDGDGYTDGADPECEDGYDDSEED